MLDPGHPSRNGRGWGWVVPNNGGSAASLHIGELLLSGEPATGGAQQLAVGSVPDSGHPSRNGRGWGWVVPTNGGSAASSRLETLLLPSEHATRGA